MNAFRWAADRLKETSTWYGFSFIFTAVGVNIDPELWKEVVSVGVSVAGLVLVATKDKA